MWYYCSPIDNAKNNDAEIRQRNALRETQIPIFFPTDAYSNPDGAVNIINGLAIGHCDGVIAHLTDSDTVGTMLEIGYAMAMKLPIVLWCPNKRWGRYKTLEQIKRADSVDDLIMFVKENTPSKTAIYHTGRMNPPAYPGDAGYDLFVAAYTVCPPGTLTRIPLSSTIAPPAGVWYSLEARSSTASRGLIVLSSVIDNGYRGPLFANAFNFTQEPVAIPSGDRIVQAVFHIINRFDLIHTGTLPGSDRGENGFGSTGRS